MKAFFYALGLWLVTTGMVSACERPRIAQGSMVLDPTQIDAGVFDYTMRVETNYQRCVFGFEDVLMARSLVVAAFEHSQWMNSVKRLSHESTLPGKETPGDRIFPLGFRSYASENLGWIPLYDFPEDGFLILNAESCVFTTREGATVAQHTYESFARTAVQALMDSPPHRANILNANPLQVGHAAVFDDTAPHCGNIYFAQKFAR